jgi:CubicO group peptidase (beta-lactamase class C family)
MIRTFASVILFAYVAHQTRSCPTISHIEKLLVQAHIPGAAIIVLNANKTLYEYAYGYDELLPERSMDVDRSIFALASISKTFIAVAVMQLLQSSRVNLDHDINDYLRWPTRRILHPQYPTINITLRQLLSHSASIKRNDEMEGAFVQLGDAALTPTGLEDACLQYLHPNASNWLPYRPGTVTLYSNMGSSLAALVVQRVTETPYDEYVREHILKPLNIDTTRAAFRLSHLRNPADLVRHYTFNQSRFDWVNTIFPQLELTQVEVSRTDTHMHVIV